MKSTRRLNPRKYFLWIFGLILQNNIYLIYNNSNIFILTSLIDDEEKYLNLMEKQFRNIDLLTKDIFNILFQ